MKTFTVTVKVTVEAPEDYDVHDVEPILSLAMWKAGEDTDIRTLSVLFKRGA
jgi:hypothetical protein